jgi:periplasmic protein TonB
MAQPEDEKPAFDAPRAANNDKRDDENAADAAKPSAAPPPPSEAPPAPAPAPEPPAAPQAPELRAAPDGDTPEVAKADPATPPDKPTPTPEKPAPAPAKKFPTFASVPDIDFGGAAMSTPVAGGNAKATYLSILYGMITPRVHVPPIARTYGRRLKGSIVFTVDGRGRLTERWVAQPSGSSELDEAAMQAVGSASPFPAPPRGAPMGMRFNYGVN